MRAKRFLVWLAAALAVVGVVLAVSLAPSVSRRAAYAQGLSVGCVELGGKSGGPVGNATFGPQQFYRGETLIIKITLAGAPRVDLEIPTGNVVDSVTSNGRLRYTFPADTVTSVTIVSNPAGDFLYEITCLPPGASSSQAPLNQISVWNVPPVHWQRVDSQGNWYTLVDENGWPYVSQPEWRTRYNETQGIWERVTVARLVLGPDNPDHNPYHYRAIDAVTGQPVGEWIEDCPDPPVEGCTSVYVGSPATTDHPGYQ